MRRGVVVAALALSAAACGPMGNTLGLEGIYTGVTQLKGDGTYKEGTQQLDVNVDREQNDTFEIYPGYDVDAVVLGGPCTVGLRASGDRLVLDQTVECNSLDDTEFSYQNNTNKLSQYSYTTVKKFEVEKRGPGQIRVTYEIEVKTEKAEDGTQQYEMDVTLEGTFEGDRSAEG